MKQAIEEEFILDVLQNYTTYRSFYKLIKSVEENPLFETQQAQRKLKAHVEGHEFAIGEKAKIMIDQFHHQKAFLPYTPAPPYANSRYVPPINANPAVATN